MAWNGALIISNGQVEIDPLKYLKTELGTTLKAKQDLNTITAIRDPVKFIEDRSKDIDKIVKDKVSTHFEARLKEYQGLGLPSDVCKELALRACHRIYQEELEIMEIAQPGAYEKAFGISNLHHNTAVAASNITNHEAVKQYKARKRAKRAKK